MKFLLVITTLILSACSIPSNQSFISFYNGEKVDFKLIAYQASSNSRFWLENQETKKIHTFAHLGAYKKPKVPLGTSIRSRFVTIHGLEVVAIGERKKDFVYSLGHPSKEFVIHYGYDKKLRDYLK